MIITRTPLRVSFAGGGTDLPSYYERFGGAVLSTAINKYIYLSMHPFFNSGYFLKYSNVEHAATVNEIKHPIIREVFRLYGIEGVDFSSSADIPSGNGLSSSSAFTTGLIHLCNAYKELYKTKEEIAAEACKVEIEILKEPIGKQDQYACACGGLNFIQFSPNGEVTVEKLYLTTDGYHRLENNLLMFYTGVTRSASAVLSEQKKNTEHDAKKLENLHQMVKLAHSLRESLLKNNIDAMGEILHQGWLLKREMASKITNPQIDEWYERAMKAGAVGGKLLGAGGGGFLLFYVQEQNHQRVRNALSDLKEMPFTFDTRGTSIIHFNKHSLKGIFR